MPVRIVKYEQAFDLINVTFTNKAKEIIKMLEAEGHTEKSICFSVWKGKDNLRKLRGDSRFWGAFINNVRKWSWPKGDPRWNEYWKRKNEEEKAKEAARQAEELKRKQWAQELAYMKRYPGFIYFIQGECGGPIKIGYTTDIKSRLSTLQSGYPDTLMILATIPGNLQDEQSIHEELASYRMRGEWFKPEAKVLAKLNEIKQATG